MKGTPITTSALAGMGPAALKSEQIFSTEATVPLAFQFPPRRYLRVPSGASAPLEAPAGREQLSANAMIEIEVDKKEDESFEHKLCAAGRMEKSQDPEVDFGFWNGNDGADDCGGKLCHVPLHL